MALIAQLGEHCTGIAEVVGSNPAQSLKFYSGLCSSSVTAALALMTVMTVMFMTIQILGFLSFQPPKLLLVVSCVSDSDFLLLCTIYNTYNINSIEEITSLKERKKNITNTSPK